MTFSLEWNALDLELYVDITACLKLSFSSIDCDSFALEKDFCHCRISSFYTNNLGFEKEIFLTTPWEKSLQVLLAILFNLMFSNQPNWKWIVMFVTSFPLRYLF